MHNEKRHFDKTKITDYARNFKNNVKHTRVHHISHRSDELSGRTDNAAAQRFLIKNSYGV